MLEFIINILSTPAILVGLMSLLGLALQRKPIEDIVKEPSKQSSASSYYLPVLHSCSPDH